MKYVILYPDFKEIAKLCKKKIEDKYPQYENTWYNFQDYNFWEKRFKVEVSEVLKVLEGNIYKKSKKLEAELIDVINIASMMIENLPHRQK